jgi:5-methyltetrahydropteroyltriglutamate--homocysteine methyltransferase
MPVPTTTIGAYPKPDDVPLRGWHEAKPEDEQGRHPSDPTRPLRERGRIDPEEERRLLDRATREIVAEQVEAGIDVPTDGEVRREHYVFYHLRHLQGIDFDNLEERALRQGGWTAYVPVVRQPIQAGPRFLRHDWQAAQAATDRPVKITVPGPLTIAGTIADDCYGDERALCAALGDALNQEIRDLAAAGCPWVQVDEPLFARHPDKALGFGVDNLARCLHKLPEETRTAVHVCCGYPAELDQADYPKADPDAYAEIAEALDLAPVEAVSLEDAHRPNDPALLEKFARTTVILGCVDVARSRVEAPDEIAGRLRTALEHIDPHRLMAAPDCGLALMPRKLAHDKLRALAAGARAV